MLIKLFTFVLLWLQQFTTEANKVVKRPWTVKWYYSISNCLSVGILCHPLPTHTHTFTVTKYINRDKILHSTNYSSIWPLPSLCSITASQWLVNTARREEQQRLKTTLTFITHKCNFTMLLNIITTQGQQKYFKSINESCS